MNPAPKSRPNVNLASFEPVSPGSGSADALGMEGSTRGRLFGFLALEGCFERLLVDGPLVSSTSLALLARWRGGGIMILAFGLL